MKFGSGAKELINRNVAQVALLAALSCSAVLAQVSPTMPPPNHNIGAPSPHRGPGEHPESVAGTVEGFVYWDANAVSHLPADSCSGLAITVSVGSTSGGPLTAYTPLGTLSNNFKYIGQVREFLAGGKISVYDVCTYAYDKVPVGPPLQVKLTVTQAAAFSPGTTPQFEILGPITIINGQCNMLPRIVNPNASDLAAHWGSCQNMAYDVNFAMLRPGTAGAGASAGTGNIRVSGNSGISGSPLLKDPAAAGTPMLLQAPKQGMLESGTAMSAQSSSANEGLQQNRTQTSPSNPRPVPSGSSYGSAANAATGVRLPAGSITGFVYWQMNRWQSQSDCQGLTVKIITVNNSGMPLQLLSTSSALTASGPQTDYSAMGTPKYMLCSYSFHDMPEGVSLRALLYGMPSSATVATPAAFQIPGGNCNSGPSSTLSYILTGGLMLCGDGAYNVNFKVTVPPPNMDRAPGASAIIPNAGQSPHGLLLKPEAQNSNVSGSAASATGGATLLSAGPGGAWPGPSQSNSGPLPKNGGRASAGATDLARQTPAVTNPGATRQTLTNADVLKMLKNGVPESVIVSSIQSAAHKFDFSSASCQELKAAHVTRHVLNAMGAGGEQLCTSVFTDPHGKSFGVPEKTLMVPSEQRTLLGSPASGPGDGRTKAEGLNSRSGPPPSKATDPQVVELLQKLGAGKSGPVVKRPQVARENAAILAVLLKQRSAADVEAAQVKLRIQPMTQAGAGGSPSQLMFASGGTGPLGQPPGAGGNQSTLQRGSSNGGSSGSTGNISSSIAHEHSFNNTAIICSTDPTFRILSVSGSADPATFTPIEQYDLYTITGCSFGNTSGKVSIYGTGSFQENFIVKFWSENSIVVSLDSNLSGLPDFDNITLVVQRNDNLQTQKPGFKFYAARKTVPLKMIPSSWVRLMYFPFSVQYSSPPSDEPGPGPNAGSAYVSRYADGIKYDPSAPEDCLTLKAYCPLNVDYYDFSQLAPGWTTDSFQVTTYPQSCPFTVTYREDFGTWNWDWAENNPNNIRGYLSDTTCSGFFAGMPLKNYRNWSGSYYALQVWVSGPRGLDPLTNQPVSQ